jgi:hypothetical protein
MAEVAEALAEGPDAHVVDGVARFYGGADFDKLTASIVHAAEAFAGEPDAHDIWRACDLPPGLTEDDIAAQVFTGGERALLDALLPALRAGSANDVKAADKLASIATGRSVSPRSTRSNPASSPPTRPIRPSRPSAESSRRRRHAARSAPLPMTSTP